MTVNCTGEWLAHLSLADRYDWRLRTNYTKLSPNLQLAQLHFHVRIAHREYTEMIGSL
jgi:hypothetical protein